MDAVISELARVEIGEWTDEEKLAVWSILRESASRHLRFPDAVWSLPSEVAHGLLHVAERFEPDDPIRRIAWLFAPHVELPVETGSDWEAHEAAVGVARAAAVGQIWTRGGADAILRLCEQVDAPWTVGIGLADADVVPDLVIFVAESTSDKPRPPAWECARAFLLRTAEKRGEAQVAPILTDGRTVRWSAELRAMVYTTLEFGPATWQAVEQEGDPIRTAYWSSVPFYGRGRLDPETISVVINNLRAVRNLVAAIRFLALYGGEANPGLILTVLEEATSPELGASIPWEQLGMDVLGLINRMQSDTEIESDRIARLEWILVPFVRSGHYEPRALEHKLSRDPAFFIEILSLAFRGEGEEPDPSPSDEVKARASRAVELLWEWHTPPGTDESGALDGGAIARWVDEARHLASEVGRRAVADLRIGEVMAHCPPGTDGVWPAEPVRDLIENLDSEEFRTGIVIGVGNARGITTRLLGAGGEQERDLAAKYEAAASSLRESWPMTSAVLTRIADSYDRDARRWDVDAEWERRRSIGAES